MKKLSAEQFQTLLAHTAIKPRIKREVRFAAAKTSRSQLREDLTTEQRVTRLQQRLQAISERLELEPLTL